MVHIRLILHHRDGRTEESGLDGEGLFMPDSYVHLPPHADHWWKVKQLHWGGEGRTGLAELEPVDALPPELARLTK